MSCFKNMTNRFISILYLVFLSAVSLYAQDTSHVQIIDKKVSKILDTHRNLWFDANVPESDGRILYDIILKNGYVSALEIGTSTGHSAIWIAWALSKTGGRLVTIEIDEDRYKKALQNFKNAGLSEYIDARHADAHTLVTDLKGPFDFVFCDADKDWYVNYFEHIWPKIKKGGCFTAHNVLNKHFRGISEFLNLINNQPDGETEIIHSSSSGISVTVKISDDH